MRIIELKWANDCAECGMFLEVGQKAEYEKTTGIFCVGHFPTDSEKIREFRLKKAEVKAQRYEGWAEKRRERAHSVLKHNERYTGDHAFNTQPGHIPLRACVINANMRACESLAVAEKMETKANGLRDVRVKGDAEKRHEARREATRAWIKPGLDVLSSHMGIVKVLKVNKKTATVQGRFSNFTYDLGFIRQLPHA